MTPHERKIIREIRPQIESGVRGRVMRIYQNLTTHRRRLPKCKCGCGKPVIYLKHGHYNTKFASLICVRIWRRNEYMKKLLAATTALFIAAVTFGANLTVAWVNGDNPVGTQTVIQWGTTSGVYTNSLVVGYGVTNVTVTNLVAGTRYYFAAKHLDPTDGDTSVNSNEAAGKTKLNPPKNLNAQ